MSKAGRSHDSSSASCDLCSEIEGPNEERKEGKKERGGGWEEFIISGVTVSNS